MPKTKELEIHTKIVDGSPSSFKAALSRSILGVTWYKFKRQKQTFHRHREHNLAVTESVYNWLYESLLSRLNNLSRYELKTDLKPLWNENGRIEAISDITVSVYMKIGELNVKKLQVSEQHPKVKIDLFYSNIDLASQKLRSEFPSIIESMGKEKFEYREYDFSSEDGSKIAEAYEVKGTPTVVVNAERKLETPTERKLRQEIEKAFAPTVVPEGEPVFAFDPKAKSTVESLANIMRIEHTLAS